MFYIHGLEGGIQTFCLSETTVVLVETDRVLVGCTNWRVSGLATVLAAVLVVN